MRNPAHAFLRALSLLRRIVPIILLVLFICSGLLTKIYAQTVEIEPNNDVNTASSLASGIQVQGGLLDQNDRDYYRLNLATQNEVTISLTTTSREFMPMEVVVETFDPSQTKIGGFTSKVSAEVNTKIVVGPGTIYISVRRATGDYYFEGSLKYYLKATAAPVSGSASVEIEPNNDVNTASSLASGIQVQGGLLDQNDRDYYRLNLATQNEVTISLTTTSREFMPMEVVVETFDPSQTKIGGFTSKVSAEVNTKIVVGPGTIYISVRRATGDYYFEGSLKYYLKATAAPVSGSASVEIEPNNDVNTASSLASGIQVQGGLLDQNDRDYYRLNLATQNEVTISLTTTSREFMPMEVVVETFDPSQTKIGGFTSKVSAEVNTKIVVGPGTIYISVRRATGDYYFEGSLKYYLKATAAPVSGSASVEIEPNNDVNTASSLASGIQVQGGLLDQNDRDYYRLNLATQNEVTISLTTTSREFMPMEVVVETFDPSQTKIGGFTSKVSAEVNTKIVVGPGTIYISVRRATGDYYFEGSLKYYLKATVPGGTTPAPVPVASILTPNLSFGDVQVGQSKTLIFSVGNTGNANLAISSIVSGNGHFSVTPVSFSVAPGAAAQVVTVAFSPTSAGSQTCTIVIAHNAAGSPSSVTFTGTGTQVSQLPALVFTPSSLTFGSVLVGESKTNTLTVTNSGGGSLKVVVEKLSGDNNEDFSVPAGVEVILTTGQSRSILVSFNPKSKGDKKQILLLTHNGSGTESPVGIPLLGSGTEAPKPAISLSLSSLAFGDVQNGQVKTLSFAVGNSGNAALAISGITVSGTDAALFTVSPNSFTVNAGGVAQTINVSFTPSSTGTKIASLSIAHNSTGSPSSVALTGIGVAKPVPDIDVLPTALTYGDVETRQSKPLTLLVANRGKVLLTVSGIASSNEMFTPSSMTLILAPGDSQRVAVTFAPTVTGTQSGILTITSDDPDEGTVKVVLSGSGVAPVVPKIEVFPTSINFGAITIGQTKTATIEVTNKGVGTLRVANIVFSSADFSIDATAFSLKAGERKSLLITFGPSKAANVNETLDIPSDDPDAKVTQVPIRATVRQPTAGPAITMQVNNLDFGQVDFGRSIDLNLPIKNEGTGPLNISNITSDNVQVSVSPASLVVQAGQSRTVTVSYRPQTFRERSGNLHITSDDPVQPSVKVPWTATEVLTGKFLQVTGITPLNGAISVVLKTEIAITFSESVFTRKSFVAVDASLFPEPASGDIMGKIRVEGNKVIFPVELTNNTSYRFVLFGATSASGAELDKTSSISFTTGVSRPVVGSIAGTAYLLGGSWPKATVMLFDQKNVQVARTVTEGQGTYQFANLPAAQYYVFAQADLSNGERVSGSSTRNPISLSSGQTLSGIDVAMRTVDRPAPGTNPTAGIAIDLDPAKGNQRSASLGGVKANQQITLALYAEGVKDLIGYGIGVEYDTTKVSFAGADAETVDEKNVLKTQNGTMLFIKTPPKGNVVSIGGALLSPTSLIAPDGGGLLGVLRFVALDGFASNAEFRIPRGPFRDLSGRDTVEVNAVASISTQGGVPAGFDTVEVAGPVSLDLNAIEGDQGLKTKKGVKAGGTVTVQLFVKNAPAISGFSVRLEYDSEMLKAGTFTASDFVPDKLSMSPVLPSPGIIDVGVGNLTGQTQSGDGFLGTVTFQVLDKFSKETRIASTQVTFSQPGGKRQDFKQRFIVTLSVSGKEVTADFSGDGIVDFNDFFLFAGAFGSRDPEFDLTGDGIVGFDDLFAFAAVFGQKVGKPSAVNLQRSTKPALLGEQTQFSDVRYTLRSQAESTDRMTLRIGLEGHQPLKGYAFILRYDPESWAFEEANGSVPLFTAKPDGAGGLQVAGAVAGGVLEKDGPIAELRFRRLRKDGQIPSVTEAVALSVEGLRMALGQAEGFEGKPAYSLGQNYPNPFNPETQIAYSLPEAGWVRLTIYNNLGQLVRTVVDDARIAGQHEVRWDGRDDLGRRVASGVYLARMEAGSFRQTQKMLLLK